MLFSDKLSFQKFSSLGDSSPLRRIPASLNLIGVNCGWKFPVVSGVVILYSKDH